MSLRLKDTQTVPPESWVYHIDEINLDVSTRNYSRLYPTVVQRCVDNNIAPPSEQEVIDQLCSKLRVPCYDDQTRQPLINKMGLPFVAPASSCCNPKKSVIEEIVI
jgi:hypothetical protein